VTPEAHGATLLATGARLGPVHLSVTDVEESRAFWVGAVGLRPVASIGDAVALGVDGRALVVLHPGAAAGVRARRTGLYHLALHLPSRLELARAVARLARLGVPNAPTDHTVSETTYLADPDGHGIELTFETPWRGEFLVTDDGRPAARTSDGRWRSGVDPLDVSSLLAELTPDDDVSAPMPTGTHVGHVHLHVGDLEAAERFYSAVIGFRPLLRMTAFRMIDFALDPPNVPHALAINTWSGAGALPPPADTARLLRATLVLPDDAALDAVRRRLVQAEWPHQVAGGGLEVADPSANPWRLEPISARLVSSG
jgi:catechol 2,3-dioxygenase